MLPQPRAARPLHDRPPARRRAPATPWLALCLALLAGALAACGGSPPQPPTGIDELVVPTPSPTPSDFVDVVDHPWLALPPGTTRVYRLDGTTGGPTDAGAVTVRATEGSRVAGVPTTRVETSALGAVPVVDLLAQDADGNVWWLGREGEWVAGDGTHEAGLWLPAVARLGDGFRTAAGGTLDERAEVVEVDGTVDAGGTTYDDVVTLRVRTGGTDVVRSYAEGVGMVRQESAVPAPTLPFGSGSPALDQVSMSLVAEP
ncbi:MAG: hypothetical protein CMH83_09085 [Nocardioides sp.]|nr:hypothetical protein [Nocardioides sp.]